MNKVGIFSINSDFHAYVISHELKNKFNTKAHIFEVDNLAGDDSLSFYTNKHEINNLYITDHNKEKVDVIDLDRIWWRRRSKHQISTEEIVNESYKDFINIETFEALVGGVINVFDGEWVNGISETETATNKLIQMKTAKECGFHLPQTIVTQNKTDLLNFVDGLNKSMIIKPMRGTRKEALRAYKIDKKDLTEELDMTMCPTMYQEFIEGTRHFRVHCFGNEITTVLIETEEVDWRSLRNCRFSIYKLPDDIENKILKFIKKMNLKMGVIDLKQSADGEYFWLEINPQGQFLFWEPLLDINLTEKFCDFIAN
ncbi:hypothetical protein FC676_11485 [Bacillus cereus]|uniref:hypothetical protein n=1 Tax=Bacillus cereus TaxID=1396 RepID=UPI0010BE7CA6|nr:hypothetical protein [Bacillus cereus]TKH73428.1 hypothetical protein FC676_11485 [Bacillus cereus]